ncbi:MAG: 50S ribosomal protein L22 [Candidatus Peregrinibacteria bacterium]|nr:50S ribosomal protein L22 [Candidatus Peregrinibacteria bacterium]MDZ4245425.1 50S ribosomal protein L22 [Candidatus Gracilibacteria bacterium]
MKAHLNQVRISPKKMNLVASMVRGMGVAKALETLKFTNKKAADILHKLISSAGANAEHNFKQDIESMMIEEIIVNEGMTYKRRQPISRGRAHPILKRTSHVTVIINVADNASESKVAKKSKVAKPEKSKKESK